VPLENRVVFQVDHEISYTIQKLKRQKFASSPIDRRKLSRAIDFAILKIDVSRLQKSTFAKSNVSHEHSDASTITNHRDRADVGRWRDAACR
jgi:hypothetical protein